MRHSLRKLQQPLDLIVIDLLKVLTIQNLQVTQFDQDNEGGALVALGQAIQLLRQAEPSIELNTKVVGWHRNFSGHSVTPPFNTIMAILRQSPACTDTKLATPYVCEFMKKRKHLPPLSVPSIDKNERRNRGLQSEATIFIEV